MKTEKNKEKIKIFIINNINDRKIDFNIQNSIALMAHGYDWQVGINGLGDIKNPI